MEHLLGLVKVRVVRGVNLACRDTRGGDPYVVVSMGDQKLKTSVKKNCLNPEWNDDLTISVVNPSVPVRVEVFDKDRFSRDDKMGNAEIDIQPILDAAKMDKLGIPNDVVIKTVSPSRENFLTRESYIVFKDGKLIQDMILRLTNVECGEVELQLEWVNLPGSNVECGLW